MARIFSLFLTILLLVFGSISLSGADSGRADKTLPYNVQEGLSPLDKRDIVVDKAIGGMREGSRIISPEQYGKKTEIPKIPGAQLNPITDTHVVAGASTEGASAAGAVPGGIFPGGSSSGALTGVNEGVANAGGLGIEPPSGTGAGGLEGGGTSTPSEPGAGAGSGLGGGMTADSGGGSLIDLDASADLSSGNVDAGISLDTDNTDKILDADLSASSGLPPETTESAISSQTDIGTEVDTSGGTVGGEADIGVEADVEGGGEGDDVANDPADGLPTPGL